MRGMIAVACLPMDAYLLACLSALHLILLDFFLSVAEDLTYRSFCEVGLEIFGSAFIYIFFVFLWGKQEERKEK